MDKLIRKILNESDFDWIKNVPSFIEITEPVSVKNPKNRYRLYWTNGIGEDAGHWSDNWFMFNNDNRGINLLTRYVKMLQNGFNASGYFSVHKLADLYFEGRADYVVADWMEDELSQEDDEVEARGTLIEMLYDDLRDMGILPYDSYHGGDATVERWWVTYFDENGIEFKTKIS